MNTKQEILKLLCLDPTYSNRSLARALKKSESTISEYLRQLKEEGFIEIINSAGRNHIRIIEPKLGETGTETAPKVPIYITSKARVGYHTQAKTDSSPSPKLRLHRLERRHEIIGRQSSLSLDTRLKLLSLNNNYQELFEIEGIKGRITTRSLLIEGIQYWANLESSSLELVKLAERRADELARKAAIEYNLSIEAKGTTSIYEIELTPFEPTKPVREKGIRTLYKDKQGRHVWLDKSLRLDAVESNHAPYIEDLKEFTVDLIRNKAWKQYKTERKEIFENIRALSQLTVELAKDVKQIKVRQADVR